MNVAKRIAAEQDAKLPPPPRILTNEQAWAELVEIEAKPVYPTPLPSLNDAIGYGGLLGGALYDVVAGPGVGKSTLAVFIAGAVADKGRALYATWEMPPGRLLARLVGGRMGRASNDISKSTTRDEVLAAAPAGMRWMNRPSLAELERAVKMLSDEMGVAPLTVTDYVQRIAAAIMRKQSRPDARMATAEASERLTEMAERTGAPIITVAAASRGGRTKATDARRLPPAELIDVARESSGIEFDSSGLFVLSDAGLRDEEGWRVRTLTVAKARYGEECHIDVRYQGASGAWRDCGRVVDEAKKAKNEVRVDMMRDAIVASLRAAGEPISRARIQKRDERTWVKGRLTDVLKLISDMIEDGTLRQVGAFVTLGEGFQ